MLRAEALWYTVPGHAELRETAYAPGEGACRVRALFSGISRGTERLVLEGRVPASEFSRMRCPYQEGDFPFPVKYGYALVGQVEEGPPDMTGKTVFLLHPHQNRTAVPATAVHVIPPGIPARRAALAANMETALNVVWDAGLAPGDHVTIIGGGVVGLLIAALAARIVGTTTTVVDIRPDRAQNAAALGARFALPADAPQEQDVVIHTSASEAGLALALNCAGPEAKVIEASWYGDLAVKVALGEAFHARRLSLISSQVGAVPAARQTRWPTTRRLQTALALLKNTVFDTLITGELPFREAPLGLPRVLADDFGLMTVLRYD